ncbi:unnamed protein product [Plutella xylostella]|uniref:(diamondback moth) hypothetical protein n=1 Tax=Plutella xylostella TaxID=51655 RepID=A0A8S4G3Z3_PLUXY|nr:unnamed protein product [Plutella xylostella]
MERNYTHGCPTTPTQPHAHYYTRRAYINRLRGRSNSFDSQLALSTIAPQSAHCQEDQRKFQLILVLSRDVIRVPEGENVASMHIMERNYTHGCPLRLHSRTPHYYTRRAHINGCAAAVIHSIASWH